MSNITPAHVNPYSERPDYTFWRKAVSGRSTNNVDPIVGTPFTINRRDKVATAGSCFAQHISRTLVSKGFSYLVTEHAASGIDADRGYGVFPARFGNIYTTRQLLQLFRRAYGTFSPQDDAWLRADGRYIDPFRPRVEVSGFASLEELLADREIHLSAVRTMIETSDIFIFTLGLTEAWAARADGAVFPLAPNVVAQSPIPTDYCFQNFTVAEVEADLLKFIDAIRTINTDIKIIMTVSPVALMATFEDSHVLVATTHSKAVLRVVAGTVAQTRHNVAYFPSYEMITGPHAGRCMYENDLREVRPEAVELVMSLFARHYLSSSEDFASDRGVPHQSADPVQSSRATIETEFLELQKVICDEEELDPIP